MKKRLENQIGPTINGSYNDYTIIEEIIDYHYKLIVKERATGQWCMYGPFRDTASALRQIERMESQSSQPNNS